MKADHLIFNPRKSSPSGLREKTKYEKACKNMEAKEIDDSNIQAVKEKQGTDFMQKYLDDAADRKKQFIERMNKEHKEYMEWYNKTHCK